MNDEQQIVWDYLTENATGYQNRKSSTQIRESCDLASGGATNEHVRDIVRQLIFDFDCCIGSLMWGTGYWIIQNQAELDRVTLSLRNRANSINERAEKLIENFNNI